SARANAQALLARAGAKALGRYRGIALIGYPSGIEAAFVSHYLAIGQDASVRVAIDAATGASPSLAHDPGYRRAAPGQSDGRVLDAYVSRAGVRRVLLGRSGPAGALGALLDQPALSGVTVSVSPARDGVSVRVHSALNPSLTGLAPARPPPISLSLASVFP